MNIIYIPLKNRFDLLICSAIIKLEMNRGDFMSKDKKFFNCSEQHEIDYLAKKFKGPHKEIVEKIKELCKAKLIHYSTHQEAEQALINAGYEKK